MPFVFGWLAGETLARGLLSRLMLTVVFWGGLGLAARKVTEANLSPAAAPYAAVAAPLLLLGWTLHAPAGSHTKVRLVEGLAIVATAVGCWQAFKLILSVPADVHVAALLGQWRTAAWTLLGFGLAAGLNAWLERSHRLLGRRSVLCGPDRQ